MSDQDLDDENSPNSTNGNGILGEEGPATLRVPAVVKVARSPMSEDGPAKGILNWKAEDESEEEEEDDDFEELLEEDLNEDCVCSHCELLMTAALSHSEFSIRLGVWGL